MLSIGKLSTGHHRYYLDQAEARVDAVESVGDGVEEYYVGGSEARGEWLGAGARQLGMTGAVDAEALRRALAGEDATGVPLRASPVPVQVAGYDLTFSAPKSVSVLFGVGDLDVRERVRAAHDRAVREAFAYVEGSAAAVRRGAGGTRVEPAEGFVAAGFRHRSSRAGDPQLHTHVLIANVARGRDGRWSALDGRRLYAHARAASFVYQAVLRNELTRTLGVRWLSVRDGIAEIAGVPKPVLQAFSRRRADIAKALESAGTTGPRAAEAAALATRRPKDQRLTFDALTQEWRARAAELGFGRADLLRTMGRAPLARALDAHDLDRIFERLAGPHGLTLRKATFSRRDVVQALAEQMPTPSALSAGRLETLADRFLASDEVIELLPVGAEPERRLTYRRRDGRIVPVRQEALYSTTELLGLERRVVATALASSDAASGQAGEAAVGSALGSRPTMGADQRAMVEHICLGGDRVAVVVGRAGSGKTYALAAAREAWQASGFPVLGVAVARRAADQLEADAGIAATSVAALIAALERERDPLPARAVLVVDEAGMVPTRQIARLLEAVEHVDGKLVLVGDHRQLPELEAGGTFRALVQRGLAVELTENRRQRERWEQRALDQLRDGQPDAALEAYSARGRIHIGATGDAVRHRLVSDWSALRHEGEAVMIARRRTDVADLNRRARDLLRETGELGREELYGFASGDLVVVKRNDASRGVTNGERGRVVAVDVERRRLVVQLRGDRVMLDGEWLMTPTVRGDPPLVHGYAITCHVAQGLTVDRALVLADEGLTSELGYTAMSRGRLSNDLYVAERAEPARAEYAPTSPPTRPALERLAGALRTRHATVLAIDSGQPTDQDRVASARHELLEARADRQRLEQRRLLPRRARLDTARAVESAAERRLHDLERSAAEQRHSARPFVDERGDVEAARRAHDRIIERSLTRGSSRGLEL